MVAREVRVGVVWTSREEKAIRVSRMLGSRAVDAGRSGRMAARVWMPWFARRWVCLTARFIVWVSLSCLC